MGKWAKTKEAYYGRLDSFEEKTGRVLPILFNTEMVQAILDGRKTVTRRLVKKSQCMDLNKRSPQESVKKKPTLYAPWDGMTDAELIASTYREPYKPGNTLYVRETWRVGAWDIRNQMIAFDYKDGTCGKLTYIHDHELFERLVNQSREDARKAKCEYNGAEFIWEKGKSPCRWHPSIHMPREAARIWLKVTDVRVERLQDMNGQDILREGINCHVHPEAHYFDGNQKMMFAELWDSTLKKGDLESYGWDANPWVWVIEFERCKKPEDGR